MLERMKINWKLVAYGLGCYVVGRLIETTAEKHAGWSLDDLIPDAQGGAQ